MAASGLLRAPRTIRIARPYSYSSNSLMATVKCLSKTCPHGGGKVVCGRGRHELVSVAKASPVTTLGLQVQRESILDLANSVRHVLFTLLRNAVKRKRWSSHTQSLLERAIVDCRFFTLLAVVGSLIGSILCFVEGCFLILESYVEYFQTMSQGLDQEHLMHLLIEAIDMFMLGTAVFIFGVGLHAMFVGSKSNVKQQRKWHSGSNLFGLFHMKSPPMWTRMKSIAQMKSKIGHAVMMILQVGLLEKFKNIPLVTGFDLACFAGAVLTSSACIFILSAIHT